MNYFAPNQEVVRDDSRIRTQTGWLQNECTLQYTVCDLLAYLTSLTSLSVLVKDGE